MGSGIFFFVLLVVAGIVAWVLLSGAAATKSIEEGADTGDLQGRRDTLQYTTPPGQDPAVVVAALEEAGFSTEPHSPAGAGRVVIACKNGVDRDRETVREVIASADTTALGDGVPISPSVRFDDE